MCQGLWKRRSRQVSLWASPWRALVTLLKSLGLSQRPAEIRTADAGAQKGSLPGGRGNHRGGRGTGNQGRQSQGVIARAWVLTSAAGIVPMGIQTGKGFVSPRPQPPNLPCGISTPCPLTGLWAKLGISVNKSSRIQISPSHGLQSLFSLGQTAGPGSDDGKKTQAILALARLSSPS